MADRPIIFSAPMVLALLAGRKTQTRRILKPQPEALADSPGLYLLRSAHGGILGATEEEIRAGGPDFTRYAIGDRLWVKENHRFPRRAEQPGCSPTVYGPVRYEADQHWYLGQEAMPGRLRPSIHMPRWASRITLLVTNVRVERLRDIGGSDALAEGIFAIRGPDKDGMRHFAAGQGEKVTRPTPLMAFEELWRSINGPEAWDANPWVVAVSFDLRGAIDSERPAA